MSKDHDNFIEQYHEYGLWIPSRTIKLQLGPDAEIDHEAEDRFFKNLNILEDLGNEPIRVYLNCPGGDVVSGMAIYDAIVSSRSRITGIVLGEASSMGALILQAFDLRVALPFSQFLLHDGSIAVSGNARDIERQVDAARIDRLKSYQILAEKTGKDTKYWSRKLQTDYILSAEQALEENLIDEIWTQRP